MRNNVWWVYDIIQKGRKEGYGEYYLCVIQEFVKELMKIVLMKIRVLIYIKNER